MNSIRSSSNVLQRAVVAHSKKFQLKGHVLASKATAQRTCRSIHILLSSSSININSSSSSNSSSSNNNNAPSLPISNQTIRTMSDLPYHLVVGMPALSPTMEAGTISEWKVTEGQAFIAGDSLAEIETDKASIDFEAQDDGVVAKILVEAGSGEINVGVPILVTVEEEDDVAAFADFVPPEAEGKAETKPEAAAAAVAEPEVVAVAAPEPEPVVEAPPAPAPAPVAAPEPVVAAVAEPTPEPVSAAAPPAASESAAATMVSPGWGNFARVKSPLASTLSASQKKYIELYGSTGQVPL